jgi:predicted N-acetyltransferase YhbS
LVSTIREATPADNDALLALTRATPMAGTIALRIDRDPDFFALLAARGEPLVLVATSDDEIIGCVSATMNVAYVNGSLERVAHIADLKVHPLLRGRRLGARLVAALEARMRARGIDLCFALVADGNHQMTPIADGSHGSHPGTSLGRFTVDQVMPSPSLARVDDRDIGEARDADCEQIAALLDGSHQRRLGAPPVTPAKVREHLTGTPTRFVKTLVARDSSGVVATLTIEDTQSLRQNVVIGLPTALRAALAAVRVATLPIRGFAVPRIGQPLTMLYARHVGCRDGHVGAFRALLRRARAEAFRRRVAFLSVGLHERDPLRVALTGMPRLTFRSQSMVGALLSPGRAETLASATPFEDFALV